MSAHDRQWQPPEIVPARYYGDRCAACNKPTTEQRDGKTESLTTVVYLSNWTCCRMGSVVTVCVGCIGKLARKLSGMGL